MENCCSCYHTETKTEYRYDIRGCCVTYKHTIGKCWGTKECEECFCKGDRTKCDFYPDIRAKAEEEEIENSLNEEITKAIELLTNNGYKVSKGEKMQETLEQKLSDIVNNALNELDEICEIDTNITYNLYLGIQDIIGDIYNELIREIT